MPKRILKPIGKSSAFQWLIAIILAFYIKSTFHLTRWKIKEWKDAHKFEENAILAFWHGRLFFMPALSRSLTTPIHVMISTHSDGEIIARTSELLGARTIRGSSRKGRLNATRESLALLRNNQWVAITPDGPKGPRQRVKPGLIQLAKKTGTPIIPIAYATSFGMEARSWDHFFIPFPFGSGAFCVGEAMRFDETNTDLDAAHAFEHAMHATLTRACDAVGKTTPEPTEEAA